MNGVVSFNSFCRPVCFVYFVFLGLVSYCIQMYEGNTIQKLVILQSLSMVLEHGCEMSYLSIDLRQYLTKFENMIADNLPLHAQVELVKCIFYLCKHVK